jgi:hypothetical protein
MAGSLEASKDDVDGAIRQTALDYVEGQCDGDAPLVERSIHQDLVKRVVISSADHNGDRLAEMSGQSLVQLTRLGPVSVKERRADVTILDRMDNIATVRIDTMDWVDNAHLAISDGRWHIVNVLRERRSNVMSDADETEAIKQTGFDYIHGARGRGKKLLERCLHQDLAKRTVGHVLSPSPVWPSFSWPPGDKLYQLSALSLIQGVGYDADDVTEPSETPPLEAPWNVKFLDRFRNMASLRVDMIHNVDYLQVARWNGEWKIINILWTLRPEYASMTG